MTIHALAHKRLTSCRSAMLVVTTVTLVALLAVMPRCLFAQDQHDSSSLAHPAASAPGTIDGRPLATGRLYFLAQFPTENGSNETYFDFVAVEPGSGAVTLLGKLGNNIRISPDGKSFAFDRAKTSFGAKPNDCEVCIANLNDPKPQLLCEADCRPIWSPDGKLILYQVPKQTASSNDNFCVDTWTIDIATHVTRKLPIRDTDEVDDWSRVGDWLALTSGRAMTDEVGPQIYVMHSDGSAEKRITEGIGANFLPRFSSDGKHIAYCHFVEGIVSVWTVDVDGANPRQILTEESGGRNVPYGVCWSPDGRWLAVFEENAKTVIVDGIAQKANAEQEGKRIELVSLDGATRKTLKLASAAKFSPLETPDWR